MLGEEDAGVKGGGCRMQGREWRVEHGGQRVEGAGIGGTLDADEFFAEAPPSGGWRQRSVLYGGISPIRNSVQECLAQRK